MEDIVKIERGGIEKGEKFIERLERKGRNKSDIKD